mgnify:CR=1 FL=1
MPLDTVMEQAVQNHKELPNVEDATENVEGGENDG